MSTTGKSASNAQKNAIALTGQNKALESLKSKVIVASIPKPTTQKTKAQEKPQEAPKTGKKEKDTPQKPTEKKAEKAELAINFETSATEVEKAEPQKAPKTETGTGKRLTMEELNDKAEKLNLMRIKYQTVREKRKQLENFTISHDNNNAQLTLVDAAGMEITTSNPNSIKKLLVDWMADLNKHLEEVEEEMRKELEVFE